MKVKLYSIGHKMPQWISAGFNEYNKRLPKHFAIELHEISGKQQEHKDSITWTQILKKLPNGSLLIALDPFGKQWSTEQLSDNIVNWQREHSEVILMIGGADGLPQLCLDKAQFKWSLSKLTFPHMLARVILAEQWYRAWSIIEQHPYHKS